MDVVVDQYPYNRSSTGVRTTLPTWALADGQEAIRGRLRNPETRARFIEGMKEILDKKGFGDYSYATVASCDWEPGLAGKTISEVNRLRGRAATIDNEITTILELVEKGRVPMVFHSMSDEDVERIMRYPNTAISSDGYILKFGEGVPQPAILRDLRPCLCRVRPKAQGADSGGRCPQGDVTSSPYLQAERPRTRPGRLRRRSGAF